MRKMIKTFHRQDYSMEQPRIPARNVVTQPSPNQNISNFRKQNSDWRKIAIKSGQK